MSTCTTCYGTNTAQPCASVGCLSTNYAKCITYSGSNLFCQQGSIGTFTFTGTAVSSPTDVTVVASATGGNGTSSTFTVIRRAGKTTYEVTIANEGEGYEVSDVLTIPGNLLGGATPANDITITVTALTPVISFGNNLDEVIVNINNRLCLISQESPSGLDYTSFNYACLRVGGNLESVGTPITTAKQFTEAVASALCSLNIRVKDVEKPQIIVDTYFGGDIISGTSTLVQILNKYGEAIGDLNDKFTINSPHTCATFTHLTNLTAKPSPTASLGTWFDWVSTNLCNNFTILDAKITEQINEHTLINTFLYGVNQPYPVSRGNNFVNTLCLTGGVSQSNIRTAVNLLVTELCSLKTTVTNASTQNYTVTPVTCLNTPFPSNSVFGNNSNLAAVVGTTTLQGHLNQIYNVLSNLNIKFDSNFFDINVGSCGPEITFIGNANFNCALLASCTLNSIGDVNTPAPQNNNLLYRNNSNPTNPKWEAANLRVIFQDQGNVFTGSTNTSYNFEYNSSSGSLQTTNPVKLPVISEASLIPSVFLPVGLLIEPLTEYAGNPNNLPLIRKIQTSGLATPSRYTGFNLKNGTASVYTINNNATVSLFSWMNTNLHPSQQIDIPITVIKKSSGGTFIGIFDIVLNIIPVSAGGATNELISLTNRRGSVGGSINIDPGEYLQIYIGGINWPTDYV